MLGCTDSLAVTPQPSTGPSYVTFDGVAFQGLSRRTGYQMVRMNGRYLTKSPLLVARDAGPLNVKVVSPRSVTLAWVPARIWIGSARFDIRDFESRWTTFTGCDRPSSYWLGGVASTQPTACATLEVSSPRLPPTRVVAALGKITCPAS